MQFYNFLRYSLVPIGIVSFLLVVSTLLAADEKPATQPSEKPDKGKEAPVDPKLAAKIAAGKITYSQLCFACHGVDGKGAPMTDGSKDRMAPALAGSKRLTGNPEIPARILLHGLTGPNDNGKTYLNEMISFNASEDEWIADVLTFARNSFGNHAGEVTAEVVSAERKASEDRGMPYTIKDLEDEPLDNRK
jgi:mono/diheme cytochrome c family protein